MWEMVYLIFFLFFIISMGVVYIYFQHTRYKEWIEDGEELVSKRALNLNPFRPEEMPAPISLYLENVRCPENLSGHALQFEESGKIRFGEKDEAFDYSGETLVSLVKPAYSRILTIGSGWKFYSYCERLGAEVGEFQVRFIASILKKFEQSPNLETAHQALFLARLPLYPQAIRFVRQIEWKDLDKGRVSVVISNGPTKAKVVFTLNPKNLIIRSEIEDFPKLVDGNYILSPCVVEFDEYTEYEGVLKPQKIRYFWRIGNEKVKFCTSQLVGSVSVATETIIKE